MKKTTLIASAAMIIAGAAIASANPFADVPYSHWAYDAINTMASRGVIQGFPDGTYKGNKNVTRYELAMITAKMIANIENGVGSVSKDDMKTLEKLTTEFADELALLGVKITALEDDMAVVKEDVAGLKKDVDGIKSYMKNGGMEKVKLSGDMLVRNYGFEAKQDGNKVQDRHHTETLLRLQLDAQIDENITARARWNMIENKNINDGAFHMTNEWDGGNKKTGDVEVAYLQIKDMFGFGGDFKFGRDWMQHGHGFVMHNYADAINYTKKCGDVDLALNAFFKRQGGEDTNQVWNINADYSYKNHDMYLGVYVAHDIEHRLQPNGDSRECTWIEFGSHGPISNSNDKVTYDLAAVYNSIEDGSQYEPNSDSKGWLGHVAFNYDSHKQLTAKLAYTMADEESWSIVNVENSNRWCDGDETIFEDMYLFAMANGDNTNKCFNNLNDLKVQVGYTLKNADKHSFRLAYDNVQNKKDPTATAAYSNTFAAIVDPTHQHYLTDVKANIITFDYTYKLAENTRIRLGYQNGKIEAKDEPDIKTNLYYAEIYSRF